MLILTIIINIGETIIFGEDNYFFVNYYLIWRIFQVLITSIINFDHLLVSIFYNKVNNICLKFQGYEVEVRDLSGAENPQLSSSATIHYDSVNRRITLTLLFEQTACLKCCVTYNGQQLIAGEFDVIVLSGKSI